MSDEKRVFISTPNGKRNVFLEAIKSGHFQLSVDGSAAERFRGILGCTPTSNHGDNFVGSRFALMGADFGESGGYYTALCEVVDDKLLMVDRYKACTDSKKEFGLSDSANIDDLIDEVKKLTEHLNFNDKTEIYSLDEELTDEELKTIEHYAFLSNKDMFYSKEYLDVMLVPKAKWLKPLTPKWKSLC